MTKKGFTLMELLVSIFISGMVMMALVAMWKASSTQTAEAQRQSIIKNESTIFLRKIYSDFVAANEIICPPGYPGVSYDSSCPNNMYIAVKEVVISSDTAKLTRITAPVCGDGHNSWSDESSLEDMAKRCIKPSYTAYYFENNNVYRCSNNFLDGDTNSIEIGGTGLIQTIQNYCGDANHTERKEMIMPYVQNFSLKTEENAVSYLPELLVDYTIKREFGDDIPPVYFKFKRFLTKKGGA